MRIEEFAGDRRKYLKWKKAIEAQEKLYRLEPGEVSMLVYLSTRAEARDVLDQVPLSELTGAEGSLVLWRLLDESFGESGAELFERAERELNSYRRLPGQAISTYLASMRRLKAQYTRIDPDTVISDRAWAQRLLNRASLSKRERLDVYYSAGGSYTASGIEAALRHRCSQVHEEERRIPTPSTASSRSTWSSRASSSRASSAPSSSTVASRRSPFGKGGGKRNGVHLATELDEIDEDEDLELEEVGDDLPEEGDHEAEDQDASEIAEEPGEDDIAMEEATTEEVVEAFAAGWKAKAKTADGRKAPSALGPRSPSATSARSLAEKKKGSTCSSCGLRGHWRGDPQCANVLSGKDPPHRKPESTSTREVNFTNFTFAAGASQEDVFPPPLPVSSGPATAAPGWTSSPTCPSCFAAVTMDQKFCRECGHKLSPKRDWEFVSVKEEAPEPRPMRDVRLPKQALTGRAKDSQHTVKMKLLEAMAALDKLTKEDKKHLRKMLQKEEDEECAPQRPLSRGYPSEMAGPAMSSSPPWVKAATAVNAALPTPPAPLQPPSRKDSQGRDKVDGVRKRELNDFRRTLWQRAWNGTRTSPSWAGPVPSENEKQARCRHDFEQLVWVANQHGHYARCKQCDLKNVLYNSERHGVLTAGASPEASPSAPLSATSGQVILDSGRRTAVAGTRWHQALQAELRRRQISWQEIEENEVFQFGAGGPEISQKAFIYPVGIYGRVDLIRVSSVSAAAENCPGLVGPSELSRWGVCFDFAVKTIEVFG